MKRTCIILCAILYCVLLTGCQCEHEWIYADCTNPKHCAKCEETEGEPLGHRWKEATCEKRKVCVDCALEEGEPLGHEWIPVTCITPKMCKNCSKTEGEPQGHIIGEWTVETAPSCSEEGLETAACSACNEVFEQAIDKLPHTEGEWVTVKEATSSADGERELPCTVCGEAIKTEKIKLTDEEKKALFKKECKDYSYNTIARNPDAYLLEKGHVRGKVIQVLEDGDEYTLRVNMNGTYGNTILVSYTKQSSKENRILEDDYVDMYGHWMGTYTYESVMGSSITVPLFFCTYLDIR